MPLNGPGDDSLEGLGAAFSELSVGGPGGKEKQKEKEAVDMGVEEEDPGDEHDPSDEVLFDDKPGGARRAPLTTLQYCLQQPLHPRQNIQQHTPPQ